MVDRGFRSVEQTVDEPHDSGEQDDRKREAEDPEDRPNDER
jgi:hypothetical protein